MRKKILLGAEHSVLDPLALYHLSDVAKQEGWESKIVMSRSPKYEEFAKAIEEFRPDVFGVSVYTGNHDRVRDTLNRAREKDGSLITIVGGPHPTYFPEECLGYAEYVVVGEGFDSLRRILRGTAAPGIVHVTKTEEFPRSDRKDFYKESPAHGKNPIKNIITGTGCFFNCSHCYNSNNISEVAGLSDAQIEEMEAAIGSRRFFPARQRSVNEVMAEIEYIQQVSPETKMLFLQDDIFGGDMEWLRDFTQKYSARMPFHANMRYELVNPKKAEGRERVELLKKAGCSGLTLAIESGSEVIRKEVLNRNTPEELIFDAMGHLGENGLKVRTNQMIGLPYGATTKPTKMNLEADLETLELSVKLREKTGLPTIPWASTLAPYPGTRISAYCEDHGFHKEDSRDIVGDETYRIESVLRHPQEWVGPTLSGKDNVWLSDEAQATYRSQLKVLMDCFPIFGLIPNGHNVTRDFLTKGKIGFQDIYNLMKEHNVFRKIRDGEELEENILKQENGTSSDMNTIVRHHIYDHDLFRIE